MTTSDLGESGGFAASVDVPDVGRGVVAPRPVLLATCSTVMATLPVFLVGAQAVQIAPQLGLSVASLGIVISVFYGCTALSSAGLGRAVQRWGVRRGLVTTMPAIGLALLSMASCHSVLQLAISLAVAGIANGAAQPSVNALLVAKSVTFPLGMSLGIKETAPPAASIAAGLAVPFVALTFGWRWSFVGGALLSILVAVAALGVTGEARRGGPVTSKRDSAKLDRRVLVLIAVVAGCGSVGGTSIGTFLVDFGVDRVQLAEGTAGIVFAIVSFSTVAGRLVLGGIAGRAWAPRSLPLTAGLMVFGSLGYLLVATANPTSFIIGGVIAGAFGWSWSVLMHFAIVSAYRGHAARVTGVLITGFATGSFAGPLVMGQFVGWLGYQSIWIIAAAFSVIGGVALWFMPRELAELNP